MEATDYASAHTMAQSRRRKLGNNTYLGINSDGSYAICLYNTQIVTFHANGDITLNSEGDVTVTTKSRINEALGGWCGNWKLWQERGVWYVRGGGGAQTHVYADGMILHPDGTVTGERKAS